MYLIVVGADAVGASLAELAAHDGHNVVVIEKHERLASELSQRLDVSVLHADIASHGIMDEAGAQKAEAMVATTGDDAANLMAMFLGAEAQVKILASVVNDAGHEGLFKRLGVGVGIFALLWLAGTGTGVVVLAHFASASFGLGDILFEVASAQGNVGLSTGFTTPLLPAPAKIALMTLMWVGRLEIFPVLVLLAACAGRTARR